MHDTISYTSLLLTIVSGVAVAAMVYLMIVLARFNRATARLDDVLGKVEDLLVELKTLAEESTGTMVAARHLIEEGTSVAVDIAAVSAHVRGLTETDAGHTGSLFDRIKSAIALIAGIRTAYSTLRHLLQSRRQTAADNIHS
jgi:hypothetical protein